MINDHSSLMIYPLINIISFEFRFEFFSLITDVTDGYSRMRIGLVDFKADGNIPKSLGFPFWIRPTVRNQSRAFCKWF